MFFVLNGYSNETPFSYSTGMNVGISYYYKTPNNQKYTGYCIGGEIFNISIEVTTAGEYKGENKYGSGGISNDYRLSSVMLGYVGYIKCSQNIRFIINPKIGFCTIQHLYNDKYYGSDVYSNNGKMEIGLDIGLRIKYFIVKAGISNMKINAQIGYLLYF
jgi:hypothetical protein